MKIGLVGFERLKEPTRREAVKFALKEHEEEQLAEIRDEMREDMELDAIASGDIAFEDRRFVLSNKRHFSQLFSHYDGDPRYDEIDDNYVSIIQDDVEYAEYDW